MSIKKMCLKTLMKDERKVRNIILVILAVFFILFQYILKDLTFKEKEEYYDEMVLAAQRMQELSLEIKNEKLSRGIEIDTNIDKNLTGLIGLEWSEISTTLGDEVAKRTSTTPDFAALLVKKIKELGLKKGDRVAVNMSSSFPALNLAVISALDILDLEGIIVNTVGSSSYGANIKDFTYLDMENHLFNEEMIKNKSIAYSFGGINDNGEEFEDEIKEKIKQKNEKYGLKFFYNKNLKKNIEERYQFYNRDNNIKLFINIGGNILAFGGVHLEIDNSDLILNKNLNIKNGLIGKFYNKNIPVIHFLNIKAIALKNKIPIDKKIDKQNNYKIGNSAIYYKNRELKYLNLIITFLFFIFIAYNVKIIKKFKIVT